MPGTMWPSGSDLLTLIPDPIIIAIAKADSEGPRCESHEMLVQSGLSHYYRTTINATHACEDLTSYKSILLLHLPGYYLHIALFPHSFGPTRDRIPSNSQCTKGFKNY
jgi:hypothetical protein